MVNAIVVGHLGYWGPILKNNVVNSRYTSNVVCVDTRDPQLKTLEDGLFWVKDEDKPLVVFIATPPATHYEIAAKALTNGCHVFVEKPMTTDPEHSNKLCNLAEAHSLKLGVDHTFLGSPHIRKIKELIDGGAIGDLLSISSRRMNLGKFQSDGVIWDLAPHDLAIAMYLTNCMEPTDIQVVTRGHIDPEVPDNAHIHAMFDGVSYYLNCSWLHPKKDRLFTVVGTAGMIEYDMLAEDKLILYDKRAEKREKEWEHSYTHKTAFAEDAMDQRQPVGVMVDEFIEWVLGTRNEFVSDSKIAHRVVELVNQMENNSGVG